MAKTPKKPISKRQSTSKRLPLSRVKKQSKSVKVWFGSTKRLEVKVIPAKKLTKKQLKAKEKRDKYISFGLIAFGLIGVVYFSAIFAAPVPAPPALAAPAVEVQQDIEPASEVAAVEAAEPSQLQIPTLSINTSLIPIGKNADNTLEVPSVYDKAGWYKLGPKPGQVGAAVLVGHVTSKTSKAIFWDLSTMKSGDLINIVDANGKNISFIVAAVKQFPQDQFPSEEVYGQTKNPSLRLITCGGTYNKFTRRYSHNTVVFADLIN